MSKEKIRSINKLYVNYIPKKPEKEISDLHWKIAKNTIAFFVCGSDVVTPVIKYKFCHYFHYFFYILVDFCKNIFTKTVIYFWTRN